MPPESGSEQGYSDAVSMDQELAARDDAIMEPALGAKAGTVHGLSDPPQGGIAGEPADGNAEPTEETGRTRPQLSSRQQKQRDEIAADKALKEAMKDAADKARTERAVAREQSELLRQQMETEERQRRALQRMEQSRLGPTVASSTDGTKRGGTSSAYSRRVSPDAKRPSPIELPATDAALKIELRQTNEELKQAKIQIEGLMRTYSVPQHQFLAMKESDGAPMSNVQAHLAKSKMREMEEKIAELEREVSQTRNDAETERRIAEDLQRRRVPAEDASDPQTVSTLQSDLVEMQVRSAELEAQLAQTMSDARNAEQNYFAADEAVRDAQRELLAREQQAEQMAVSEGALHDRMRDMTTHHEEELNEMRAARDARANMLDEAVRSSRELQEALAEAHNDSMSTDQQLRDLRSLLADREEELTARAENEEQLRKHHEALRAAADASRAQDPNGAAMLQWLEAELEDATKRLFSTSSWNEQLITRLSAEMREYDLLQESEQNAYNEAVATRADVDQAHARMLHEEQLAQRARSGEQAAMAEARHARAMEQAVEARLRTERTRVREPVSMTLPSPPGAEPPSKGSGLPINVASTNPGGLGQPPLAPAPGAPGLKPPSSQPPEFPGTLVNAGAVQFPSNTNFGGYRRVYSGRYNADGSMALPKEITIDPNDPQLLLNAARLNTQRGVGAQFRQLLAKSGQAPVATGTGESPTKWVTDAGVLGPKIAREDTPSRDPVETPNRGSSGAPIDPEPDDGAADAQPRRPASSSSMPEVYFSRPRAATCSGLTPIPLRRTEGPLMRLIKIAMAEEHLADEIDTYLPGNSNLVLSLVIKPARLGWRGFTMERPGETPEDRMGQAMQEDGVLICSEGTDRYTKNLPVGFMPCDRGGEYGPCKACVKCELLKWLRPHLKKALPDTVVKKCEEANGTLTSCAQLWYTFLCDSYMGDRHDVDDATTEMETFSKRKNASISTELGRLKQFYILMKDFGLYLPRASVMYGVVRKLADYVEKRLKHKPDERMRGAIKKWEEFLLHEQYESQCVINEHGLVLDFARHVSVLNNNYPHRPGDLEHELQTGATNKSTSSRPRDAKMAVPSTPMSDIANMQCKNCLLIGHCMAKCTNARHKDSPLNDPPKNAAGPKSGGKSAPPKKTAKKAKEEPTESAESKQLTALAAQLKEMKETTSALMAAAKGTGKGGGGKPTKAKTPCTHFMKGTCKWGANCHFSHDKPPATATSTKTPKGGDKGKKTKGGGKGKYAKTAEQVEGQQEHKPSNAKPVTALVTYDSQAAFKRAKAAQSEATSFTKAPQKDDSQEPKKEESEAKTATQDGKKHKKPTRSGKVASREDDDDDGDDEYTMGHFGYTAPVAIPETFRCQGDGRRGYLSVRDDGYNGMDDVGEEWGEDPAADAEQEAYEQYWWVREMADLMSPYADEIEELMHFPTPETQPAQGGDERRGLAPEAQPARGDDERRAPADDPMFTFGCAFPGFCDERDLPYSCERCGADMCAQHSITTFFADNHREVLCRSCRRALDCVLWDHERFPVESTTSLAWLGRPTPEANSCRECKASDPLYNCIKCNVPICGKHYILVGTPDLPQGDTMCKWCWEGLPASERQRVWRLQEELTDVEFPLPPNVNMAQQLPPTSRNEPGARVMDAPTDTEENRPLDVNSRTSYASPGGDSYRHRDAVMNGALKGDRIMTLPQVETDMGSSGTSKQFVEDGCSMEKRSGRVAFPAKRGRAAKTAKAEYTWDSGASDVHGPKLPGDITVAEVPVRVAGSQTKQFELNQHDECLADPGEGLLPVAVCSEQRIRSTHYLSGQQRPWVGKMTEAEAQEWDDWFRARPDRFKQLISRNGVAVMSAEEGREIRLELRARKMARRAVVLKKLPLTMCRFYATSFKPPFLRPLMDALQRILKPQDKKFLTMVTASSTHVKIQTPPPQFVPGPGRQVAHDKSEAPEYWKNVRVTTVFGLRPKTVDGRSVEEVVPLAMYRDGLQHAAPVAIEKAVPAKTLDDPGFSQVVVATFFWARPGCDADDAAEVARDAAELEAPNAEAVRRDNREDGRSSRRDDRSPTRGSPGTGELGTGETPSGPAMYSLTPAEADGSTFQIEDEYEALRATRCAFKAKTMVADFKQAARRIGTELGGENSRCCWVECVKCGCASWAMPVTGRGTKEELKRMLKEAEKLKTKKDATGRVLAPCDDVHDHLVEGCCTSKSDCGICQRAHLTSIGRVRGSMRCQIGEFSVDLVVRLTEKSEVQACLVLVGYQRDPENPEKGKVWTVVVCELDEKGADAIYHALIRAILQAEYLWEAEPLKRVHSDREPGLVARIPQLREQGINVTLTEAYASDANPMAESAIRRISETGKAHRLRALERLKPREARADVQTFLWHFSLIYTAMLLTADAREAEVVVEDIGGKKKKPRQRKPAFEMPVVDANPDKPFTVEELEKYLTLVPEKDEGAKKVVRLRRKDFALFMERVLYRKGHKKKPDKEEPVARVGWYLHPSPDIPHGSVLIDDETGEIVFSTTVRRYYSRGSPVFPETLTMPAVQRDPALGNRDDETWVQCDKCLRWRAVPTVVAEEQQWIGDDPFQCWMLTKVLGWKGTCHAAEEKAAWDRATSKRKSGKDPVIPLKDRRAERDAAEAREAQERDPLLVGKPKTNTKAPPAVVPIVSPSASSEPIAPKKPASELPAAKPNATSYGSRLRPRGPDGKAAKIARVARHLLVSAKKAGNWLGKLGQDAQEKILSWAETTKFDNEDSQWFMRNAKSALQYWTSEDDVRFGTDPVREDFSDPDPIEMPVEWQCEDHFGNLVYEDSARASALRAATAFVDEDHAEAARMSERVRQTLEENVWPGMRKAKVVKVFALKDAKNSRPKYKETVAAELGRHMEFSTYGKPIAKQKTPYHSVFYRGKLIYGVKNWETPAEHKDKARMVIQGCIRVTRLGKVLLEKHFKKPGEFWAPNSSMAGLRLVSSVGVIHGEPIKTIDLDCAYLQSYAREEDRYIIFPQEVMESMPDDWQALIRKEIEEDIRLGGSGEVVFPQLKNIYGKSDAGTNFINDFQTTLEHFGWVRLPHCHGTFLRFCPKTGKAMVLANYVDDLAVVLTPESADLIWDEIRSKWKFDPPKDLEKFLGIVCQTHPEDGHRRLDLQQRDLIDKVVADYEEKTSKTIRGRKTLPDIVPPLLDPVTNAKLEGDCTWSAPAENEHGERVRDDDDHMAVEADHEATMARRAQRAFMAMGNVNESMGSSADDERGGWMCTSPLSFCHPVPEYLQSLALKGTTRQQRAAFKAKVVKPPGEAGTLNRSAVGALFYAARGTRLDLMKGIHELARRVTKWTPECDVFLEALLGYAKGLAVGLTLDARGMPRDVSDWHVDLSTDARYHAPYSTTGIVIALAPTNPSLECFLTLDWTSHAQKYVKLSVAESEAVSAVHGMKGGLRYQSSWTMISGGDPMWCLEEEEPRPCDIMRQRQDNTACILQLERGWSEKMSLLPILYGCSAEWAAERIRERRVHVTHEKTADMMADPLTKMTAPTVLFRRGLLIPLPSVA